MAILVDTRINKFVEGFISEEGVIGIKLNDIDETFWFGNEAEAQEFLNKQATERVADKQLRKGYFDYNDEYGNVHRYDINEVVRGKITSFIENVI